jgi:hypothetical protein
VNAIDSYGKAIALYPYMGEAYFNRGLVLIYLKTRRKAALTCPGPANSASATPTT